jgi:hypothetical protein
VPIDFAAIAARFDPLLTAQTRPLIALFERLEVAVKRWQLQAASADRATRAYPIMRYRDGALGVHVELGSSPPLARAAPPGVIESLRSGGEQFVAGVGWVRTAVEQETIIPRFVGVGVAALAAVVDSLDRFSAPFPGMFDRRERRLSDLFGLVNLGFQSLLTSRDDLLAAAGGAARSRPLYDLYNRLLPDPEKYRSMPAIDVFVDKFRTKAESILTVILLLPILGGALAVLVADGAIFVKRRVLTTLRAGEAALVGLRAAAIDGLIAATDYGRVAWSWLTASQVIVTANLLLITLVMPSLVDNLLGGIQAFAAGITEWGRWASNLAETIRAAMEALFGFDLVPYLLGMVLPSWLLSLLPALPSVTIGDLVSLIAGEVVGGIRDKLETWLSRAETVLDLVGAERYRQKLADIRSVIHITLSRTPIQLPPDVMPTGPLAGFPDIYEAFFGGGRRALLLGAIDGFGRELRTGMRDTLGGTGRALTDLGAATRSEAERSATLGSPARIRALAASSAGLAEETFGPERRLLEQGMARRRPDLLAQAFESVVASRGFWLVGAAIPAYIGEMRAFWVSRRERVDRPTSPHILARHGRLAVVRVPRLTFSAPRRMPDGTLAGAIDARFREQVGAAWLAGRREFVRLEGAA